MAIFRFSEVTDASILDFFKFETFKKFQILKKFNMEASVISENKFNGRTAPEGRTASPCQIWSKSVSQTVAEILRFFDFSDMAASCYVCVPTTHEGHLVVFIAVQNLVGVDAVVLIICVIFDFASLAGKRLFMPRHWVFGDLTP